VLGIERRSLFRNSIYAYHGCILRYRKRFGVGFYFHLQAHGVEGLGFDVGPHRKEFLFVEIRYPEFNLRRQAEPTSETLPFFSFLIRGTYNFFFIYLGATLILPKPDG